jgi:hypothetical protein
LVPAVPIQSQDKEAKGSKKEIAQKISDEELEV